MPQLCPAAPHETDLDLSPLVRDLERDLEALEGAEPGALASLRRRLLGAAASPSTSGTRQRSTTGGSRPELAALPGGVAR